MHREFEALAAEIFADVLETDPEHRERLLDTRCGSDVQLRARVESLVAAHQRGQALFASTAIRSELQDASAGFVDRNLGRRIGPYEITQWLATGGMGRVYLAERRDADFEQRVAIKLLHAGTDPASVLERFRSERRLLARLEHPNIARLIDGGSTEDGELYLAMEYVDGLPVDRYCDDECLTLRDRVMLFCEICEAVQFAHRHLVVHRDLKPANLLVDARGHVKLLDFGIAKVVDPDLESDVTATAHRAMTPRYASPEQLVGEPVTTVTDIYSLGVVLYELLTGCMPFGTDRLTVPEFARLVSESNPPPPSTALRQVAIDPEAIGARRGTTARKLMQQLGGDLDTIVLKALRREPQRRYASVEEFASDLRRHLTGLPVLARPDTMRYRVTKFTRRNRALVVGVAVAFAALGAGLVASLKANRVALAHRNAAEWLAYQSSIAAAESSIRTNRLAEARRQLDAAPLRLRGWEWGHLAARLDRSELQIAAHDAAVTSVQFAAGDTRIVSTSEDRTVRIWDARTGESVARFGPLEAVPRTLAVDASARFGAIGLEEGRMHVLDLASGAILMSIRDEYDWNYYNRVTLGRADPQLALLDLPSSWMTVDFHPDGRLLAVGGLTGKISVLDVTTGAATASWNVEPKDYKHTVRFHPTRNLLGVAAEVGPITLYDPASARLAGEIGGGGTIGVVDFCFDPRGRYIAAGSQDQSIRVWDLASGAQVAHIMGFGGSIRDLEFDLEGACIIATSTDGQLASWEIKSGRRRWVYPGSTVSSPCLSRSAGGNRLVSGAWDGSIRVWRLDTQDVRSFAVPGAGFRRHWATDAAFMAGSQRLVTAADGLGMHVWDPAGAKLLADLK